ncbi:NADH-quinone oxidoreductase subunit J family protein [Aeromicrobium sp.]
MTVAGLLFLVLSALAVFSALLVVSTDQLVHAALWLVITLGAIAGCYLLLTAEFVAWVQVLIYVGSVVVLLLFALMLTRAPTGPGSAENTGNRYLAAGVGITTTGALATTMYAGFNGEQIDGRRIGSAKAIGNALFNDWVLGFEILSVVLLSALIGAIVLTRSGDER